MKTLQLLFVFLLLNHLNSCKDREIEPDDVPREYILKGKLLNGTTMEPLYPGLWLNLKVSDMSALPSPKFETIGSCQIQQDGSFELQYPHNKLAQSLNASMRLESSFYISPTLPRNQDVDTVLYKSSWGQGLIQINDVEPFNKIYWFLKKHDNHYKFDSCSSGSTQSYTIRHPKVPGIAVFFDNMPISYDTINEIWTGDIPMKKTLSFTGDPYIDTLVINY